MIENESQRGLDNYDRDKEKGTSFYFFDYDIYLKEKKLMLMRTGIILLCSIIMLIFSFDKEYEYSIMYIIPIEYVAMVALLYGLSGPLQILYLKRKCKKCPQCIKVCEESIWIDDERYTYDTLRKIRIISPSKGTTGMTGLNYYLWIDTNGKRMKYWMGSSISYDGYGKFCDTIIRALNQYPGKLKY